MGNVIVLASVQRYCVAELGRKKYDGLLFLSFMIIQVHNYGPWLAHNGQILVGNLDDWATYGWKHLIARINIQGLFILLNQFEMLCC